ncbi:MAG: ABC transporter ATP-binding protein [Hyphomicrobiaceae bacterium]
MISTLPSRATGADPATTPVVSCRDLGKTYMLGERRLEVLKGISFDIMPAEFVAIMGPSGSGKSTLLNLIGALDTPTSGHLSLAGTDITARSSDELAHLRNRLIGFVFQQFNLLRRTSALENVKLPLLYSERQSTDPDSVALQRLAQVGLADRSDHTSAQLSGGQQQRVAIARALVTDPQLILADEPTGALDTKTSKDIMELFTRLHDEGMTIIMVTHEPDIAAYAGRLLRFRDGELIEDVRQVPKAMS